MTHLRIELNTTPEIVTSGVIHKLYETAKAIIDAEEANDVQESLVSLKGNLLVSKAYGDEVDWLETKFPDLHITAGARYIRFADPEVERICVNVLNWGDGTGCTEDDLYAINTVSGSVFGGNTSITAFNELQYFKPTALNQKDLLKGCSSLTEVTLPSGTPYIGQDMFMNCSNLTTIRNTEFITEIKGLANCSKLVSINTPNLISVGNWGCSGCTLLSTIDTSNVTSIGQSSFLNCTSLTSIDLSNVTSIGESAFEGCTGLTSIDLSNVTTIGTKAFKNTSSLRGNIVLNLTQSTITNGVFKGSGIDTIKIIDTNCTRIYNGSGSGVEPVFDSCSNLTSIDLTGCTSLTRVGPIRDCGNLKTVLLPASVNDLAYNAFNGCLALETLVVPNTTMVDFATGNNALYFIRPDTVKIYVPDNLVSSYQSYDNGRYANRIYSMNDMSADLKAIYAMS